MLSNVKVEMKQKLSTKVQMNEFHLQDFYIASSEMFSISHGYENITNSFAEQYLLLCRRVIRYFTRLE